MMGCKLNIKYTFFLCYIFTKIFRIFHYSLFTARNTWPNMTEFPYEQKLYCYTRWRNVLHEALTGSTNVQFLYPLQELEVYDAVVDVRCYELAALFLCSVFVPKCGPTGQLVRPCRNLCYGKEFVDIYLEIFHVPNFNTKNMISCLIVYLLWSQTPTYAIKFNPMRYVLCVLEPRFWSGMLLTWRVKKATRDILWRAASASFSNLCNIK
jgi:hypothetical protein